MLKWLALFYAIIVAANPANALLFGSSGPGGDVLLTAATVVEPSGTSQTEAFTLGLPLKAGVLDGTHSIKVIDQDSGSAILCEENNRASNLTPSVQMEGLDCVAPFTASETKALKIYVTAGASATGTDCSLSDITSTAYDGRPIGIVSINGAGGTTSVSALTGLSSGNSGWINPTTATVLGQWRHGGGLDTEWIVYVPVNAQLHIVYDVECFKAQRTAVSGGNPILMIETTPIVENAFIQQTTTALDNWYGLTDTDATSFTNSTPSIALTLGQSAVGGNVTVTAGASLFSCPNSIGKVISNGTGVAVVEGCTNATTASVNIYKAFGSTTVGSGTWTFFGLNHAWGARYPLAKTFWTPSGSTTWPTVEAGNVYLGNAWNTGALTGGPFAYIAATKLIMNYNTAVVTPASCSNSLTNLAAVGNVPTSYIGGGFQFGAGGANGDLPLFIETSGEQTYIGVSPDWDICALIRYDANAAARIFGNAWRWATLPIAWRDNTTGLTATPTNGTDWAWTNNTHFSGTIIGYDGANLNPQNTINPYSPDGMAHDPEDFYVAALLTDNYFYVQAQNDYAFGVWAQSDPGFAGSQNNRTFLDYQERGVAWSFRTVADYCLLAPDTNSNVLGWSKSVCKSYLAAQYTATNSGTPFTAPYPGMNTSFVNNTGAGKTFAMTGIRYFVQNNGANTSVFEQGYSIFELFHMYEQGMLDTNGLALINWYAETESEMINDSSVNPEYTVQIQYIPLFNNGTACPGTAINTWPAAYQNELLMYVPPPPSGSVYIPSRMPNQTMTLSAKTGTITATISGGYFANGAASGYYVGGWVWTNDGGQAQITGISHNAGTGVDTLTLNEAASQNYPINSSCVATTGAAFSSLSYANGTYGVPSPAPGDPAGTDWTAYLASPGTDYLQINQADNLLMNEYGFPGEPAAYNTVWGFTSGAMSLQELIKWVITTR